MHESSVRIEHTHDPGRLIDSLAPIELLWKAYQTALQSLSANAVIFRYPGRPATSEMTQSAVDHTIEIGTRSPQGLGNSEIGRNRPTRSRPKRIKPKRKKKP
ncbi:MAG: hypothetical protein HRU71_01560 [Planctomycetia bacterium]|nr:MAG: hypothetical protein HRU71_01560 [Planctomycetia bacterium]